MPDLTGRAEEALLGAVIADPGELAAVTRIDAGAFTDPARQATWSAVSRLREVAPGADGPEFARLIDAMSDSDLVTYDYLADLAVATPTPGAADVYARMVIEASVVRDFAADLESAADPGTDADVAVARTMASYARNITAARAAAADDPSQPGPPPADPHAALEEQFLAGLMRSPVIGEWLAPDPEALSPRSREIYEAITSLSGHGEPVDMVTLPWALARAVATRDVMTGRTTTPESFSASIPPGTIARLAAAPADNLTAMEAGRELMADHSRALIAAAGPARSRDEPGPAPVPARDRAGLVGGVSRPLLQPPPASQLQPGRQIRQEGS